MLTDPEILALSRRVSRGEITLGEMSDTFEAHGVTTEHNARVEFADLARFGMRCCQIALAVVAVREWLVWMVNN
jgi:hypothetical protein